MKIAIDIDGTIAGKNMAAFAQACNKQFNIQMDQTNLATITYRAFMAHETVVAYRQRIGEEAFEDALYQIAQSPEMLAILPALPYAVAGVKQLTRLGQIAYYTVRKHEDEQQALIIQKATTRWLHAQGFPSPDNAVFCWSVCNKLIKLHHHTRETNEPVVLIDDWWQKAVEEFDHLANSQYKHVVELLRKRLVLIAYGTSLQPEIKSGLRVVPLPSWSHIDDILPLFQTGK